MPDSGLEAFALGATVAAGVLAVGVGLSVAARWMWRRVRRG